MQYEIKIHILFAKIVLTVFACCYSLLVYSYSLNADSINKSPYELIKKSEVKRQISILAADSMVGRGLHNGGAIKAGKFIVEEYKQCGLEPSELPYTEGFWQTIPAVKEKSMKSSVCINNKNIPASHTLFITKDKEFNWSSADSSLHIPIERIKEGDNIFMRLQSIETTHKQAILLVDSVLKPFFISYKSRFKTSKKVYLPDSVETSGSSFVMILGNWQEEITSFDIHLEKTTEPMPLFNLVGAIPGKSKKEEFVIFSAHYDNLGIIAVNKNDSIANGADENASGVTAVLQLARYFKEKDNAERTLLFINYGAETGSSLSSSFFAEHIDADKIIAVINIDAIGKAALWREHSAFITGYNKDNLGSHFTNIGKQRNFKFKPDPYSGHLLFYRASNTSLALKGVPAHTFSTIQIDRDRYLNSVRDDMNTIELENMTEVIQAIALGSEALVNGTFTPSRVKDFRDNPSNPPVQKQKKKK